MAINPHVQEEGKPETHYASRKGGERAMLVFQNNRAILLWSVGERSTVKRLGIPAQEKRLPKASPCRQSRRAGGDGVGKY